MKKKEILSKQLWADQEFQKGKHSIGWIDSDFHSRVGGKKEFSVNSMPTFQKTPRVMDDAEIESELKPGLCDLGDVLAFLDNAPEECKDGNWNLFYFQAFVVGVCWGSSVGAWSVYVWGRDGYGWGPGSRVFSPATGSPSLGSNSSESLTLPKRSEYWNTMVNILEAQFPKGECQERGRALVMLSYIEMMLRGHEFDENGDPVTK